MATLFALGTIGFYILLVIYFLSAIIALENDSPGWTFTFTIVTICALLFLGNKPALMNWWNTFNVGIFVMECVGYIVAGVLWSFFKWYLLLIDWKKLHPNYKDLSHSDRRYRPEASENKAKITAWTMYWPLSVVGFIFNKPIRRFFSWLYEQISGTYDRITEKVLS